MSIQSNLLNKKQRIFYSKELFFVFQDQLEKPLHVVPYRHFSFKIFIDNDKKRTRG